MDMRNCDNDQSLYICTVQDTTMYSHIRHSSSSPVLEKNNCKIYFVVTDRKSVV